MSGLFGKEGNFGVPVRNFGVKRAPVRIFRVPVRNFRAPVRNFRAPVRNFGVKTGPRAEFLGPKWPKNSNNQKNKTNSKNESNGEKLKNVQTGALSHGLAPHVSPEILMELSDTALHLFCIFAQGPC